MPSPLTEIARSPWRVTVQRLPAEAFAFLALMAFLLAVRICCSMLG